LPIVFIKGVGVLSYPRDFIAANARIPPVLRRLVSIVAVTLTFAGCFSVEVHTSGAASVDDLAAENAYIAVYMQHMTQLGEDLKVFLPSGSNPGPCTAAEVSATASTPTRGPSTQWTGC